MTTYILANLAARAKAMAMANAVKIMLNF